MLKTTFLVHQKNKKKNSMPYLYADVPSFGTNSMNAINFNLNIVENFSKAPPSFPICLLMLLLSFMYCIHLSLSLSLFWACSSECRPVHT